MYFTEEKIQKLTTAMAPTISYDEAENRSKKIFILTPSNLHSLIKCVNPHDLPKPMGGFSIKLNCDICSRNPILLRVLLKEDAILQVDCYNPDTPPIPEFSIFIKLDKSTETHLMIPVERTSRIAEKNAKIVKICSQNAKLAESAVIAVLYGMQEKVFQRCGVSINYTPKIDEINKRLANIIEVKPYTKTVNGKVIKVNGYRKYRRNRK